MEKFVPSLFGVVVMSSSLNAGDPGSIPVVFFFISIESFVIVFDVAGLLDVK